MKSQLFGILFMFFSISINAQNRHTTVCNPLNLNYRYQLDNPSRREAADPSMILFKGKYYLFASKSGGYWTCQGKYYPTWRLSPHELSY